MRHFPLRKCGYAIAFLLAVMVLYGGAYLAMMERFDTGLSGVAGRQRPMVTYRFGGGWSEWLFAPAHEVDGRMRPDLWENEIEPHAFRRFRTIVETLGK